MASWERRLAGIFKNAGETPNAAYFLHEERPKGALDCGSGAAAFSFALVFICSVKAVASHRTP
jgi:hypothetical protein